MNERLHQLFARHLQQQLNADERTELMGLLLEPGLQNEVQQLVHAAWETSGEEEELPFEKREALLRTLLETGPVKKAVPMRKRWLAAASILLLLMTGAYFAFFYKKEQTPLATVEPGKDVEAPKTTKAHITLADGRIVLLDSLSSVLDKGVEVMKKNGEVVYKSNATAQQFNTLVNPRGSQVVNLMLADGSRVWLNAASSLKYFTGNTGNERMVEITGEGYFEVAKNVKRPFIVKKGNTSVTVLGTGFNVNAYDDEPEVKITLLEGSVKVGPTVLKPGEQAIVTHDSRFTIDDSADTSAAIAWKNGWFSFNDADVPAVMRQLARWYNIEVTYEGDIPARTFTGEIDRSLTLNQVLKGVTKTGIRYKFVSDKKITILPLK